MTTVASWLAYRCRQPTRKLSRLSWTAWAIPIGMKAITPLTSSSYKNREPATPGSRDGASVGSPSAVYRPRLGIEIEMVVAHAYTGASLPVDAYFEALRAVKQEKGVASQKISLGGRCVALQTDQDRKSGVEGKSVSVRVSLGGRRYLKKKKTR